MQLSEMTRAQLEEFYDKAKKDYEVFKAKGLSLDMSRGKPAADQLDISMGLLDAVNSKSDMKDINGADTRNYGALDGIPEAKKLFADLLEVNTSEVFVAGNSSLNIMYDLIAKNLRDSVYQAQDLRNRLAIQK